MYISFKKFNFLAFITTELTQPLPQQHFDTQQELFGDENQITISFVANPMILHIPEYQKAVNEGRVQVVTSDSIRDWKGVNVAICEWINNLMDHEILTSSYLFPHRLISFYTTLVMGFSSPYTDDFQHLVNLAYSAGLHQIWRTFYELKVVKNYGRKQYIEERSSLLELNDLTPLFFALTIGYIAGILVFLGEIFYNEFLSQISLQILMRKWAWKENKKRTVKVIQVRPVNEEESQ